MTILVGIIGGSGLYDIPEVTGREEVTIQTPFGAPSGPYVTGTLRGQRVAFLARHGVGHRLLPSDLNFRANIFGFKTLGVKRIVSASAVGSLQERYQPLDLVIPDQFLDRTRGRVDTFFGRGIVVYVCIEGPQFSTLAESKLYQAWGMGIIGMTNLQEAKLAREAEICYATLALVTDYDCWHPSHDEVTVKMIVANLQKNAVTAQRVISDVVARLSQVRTCKCSSALENAIITVEDEMPSATRAELEPIIGKYLKS